MTDRPTVPADEARARGEIVTAAVHHTFSPGYRPPGAGHLTRPDEDRCTRCGARRERPCHQSPEEI